RNPLLEAAAAEPSGGAEERDAHEGEREQVLTSETSLSLSEDGPLPGRDGDLDTDYDNVYADESRSDAQNDAAASVPGQSSSDWQNVKAGGGGNADGEFSFEATLTREPTLTEHLTEQMNMALKTPGDRLIGGYLIDQVNEAGYMTADLADVAERLGTDVEDVEAVLRVLQTFEPTGVCARNLKECLALQLAERDRLDPTMQVFLDHLELFAKRDFDQLMKLTGADREDIASMVDDIRLCNPKPGLALGNEPVVPVVPDVFVRAKADGSWAVEINSETPPRVLVTQQCHAEVSRLSPDAT